MTEKAQYRFDVALSFPGEHRARVERIAQKLANRLVGQKKVLYDKWYAAEFARPNLDLYLPELYHKQSMLLVFFLCAAYTKKEWCGLEWRVGRELLKGGQDERLMLLRLDHADIPGLYGIDGYFDISDISDEQTAAAIIDRLAILTRAKAPELDAVLSDLRANIHSDIAKRCGTIKILTMEQPIELGAVYTEVNILEQLSANRRKTRDELFREAGMDEIGRFGLPKVEGRIAGLRALDDHQRVIIYGKPGAGKTTFLKRLAMECAQGNFRAELVPAFVTLREYAEAQGSPELADYIGRLWRGRPPWSALRAGRALILLDGLDEVRDRDFDRVRKSIDAFAIEFDSCSIILTCRIAAREYAFEQFTEVEMTDFSEDQIQTFAERWFVTQREPETRHAFAEKLKANRRVLELASNPLLLTLLCLVFQERRDFGETRAKLYREGLDILLRKWDAKRGITRDLPYGLTIEAMEMLVSEVAYRRFLASEYFFDENSLEKQIEQFFDERSLLQPDEVLLAERVLNSIESHLGLLVQRALQVYSFSHLTFQEYLTAWRIAKKPRLLSEIGPMIGDPRWREVWLLLVTMVDADDIIRQIKEQIDRLVEKDAMAQKYLRWCNRKAARLPRGAYNRSAVRAFYFDLPLALDRVLDRALDRKRILDGCEEISLDRQLGYAIARAFDRDPTTRRDLDGELASAADAAAAIAPALALKLKAIRAALARERVPLKSRAWFWRYLWSNDDRVWSKKLRAAAIRYRDVGHDWGWTESQHALLRHYYLANQFLIDCMDACRGLTNKTRQFIEDTMLLPWDEIPR